MEIISQPEVKKRFEEKQRGEFTLIIEQLPSGAALKIHPAEWSRKESIQHFFLTRFNKGGVRIVSVRRFKGDYYVIKL